jgi:hypothetical protein
MVRRWLARRGRLLETAAPDRRLRACLVAQAGRGFLFVDQDDPEDERRFSLAHEVAHFICDYLAPREQALAVLGESVRAALDGARAPRPEERLSGLLAGLEVGTYRHLMERSLSGDVLRMEVLDSEDGADRIAIELLAPRSAVHARLRARRIAWSEAAAHRAVRDVLAGEFGLPGLVADRYAAVLVTEGRDARSFREWLGA